MVVLVSFSIFFLETNLLLFPALFSLKTRSLFVFDPVDFTAELCFESFSILGCKWSLKWKTGPPPSSSGRILLPLRSYLTTGLIDLVSGAKERISNVSSFGDNGSHSCVSSDVALPTVVDPRQLASRHSADNCS